MRMMLALIIPLIYSTFFFFSFPDLLGFSFFVIGVIIGYFMIILDRLVHALYLFPDTEFSHLVQEQWRKRSLIGLYKVLQHAETLQTQLITRSAIFLLCYLVLTIFVLTSTGSILGIGVVLGMGLRYLIDFWRLSKQPEQFKNQFLWQVKYAFSSQEVRWIVLSWAGIFLIISLLVLL